LFRKGVNYCPFVAGVKLVLLMAGGYQKNCSNLRLFKGHRLGQMRKGNPTQEGGGVPKEKFSNSPGPGRKAREGRNRKEAGENNKPCGP